MDRFMADVMLCGRYVMTFGGGGGLRYVTIWMG